MDKKNYQSNKSKKGKGSGIITGIAIFLVVILALGTTSYFFKDDITSLFKKPVIEEPKVEEPKVEEPIIEEPVIEEPVIVDPLAGALVEGMTLQQIYFNVAEFETIIKNNIDKLEKNTDQPFGRKIVSLKLPVFDIRKDNGSVGNFDFNFEIGITTFSEVLPLFELPLPEGVSETDFCLFLTNESYVEASFYSSVNTCLSNGNSDEDLYFVKGFNTNYIDSDSFGQMIDSAILELINSNPDMSNYYQKQPSALFTVETIYNKEVCDLILKDRKF